MAEATVQSATRPKPRLRITFRGIVYAALVGFYIVVPFLAGTVINAFWLDVCTRILILTIAAVSLNFILGFGGMVSFGHAAFIGLGAYAVGGMAEFGYYNGYWQWTLGIAVAALFALVTGAISLRTRGVYFIMITLAFAQMVNFLFESLEVFYGDDGMPLILRSQFPGLIDLGDDVNLYYLTLAVMLASVYLVHRLVNSRFGMVIQGAKSNEPRMRALGYPIYRYKLTAYVIAGVMCGIAGLLQANYNDFVSPAFMKWDRSGDLIIMVVFGGMGTLWGPVVGALAFLMLEEFLADAMRLWRFWMGVILILVVLFARGGIDSFLDYQSLKARWRDIQAVVRRRPVLR